MYTHTYIERDVCVCIYIYIYLYIDRWIDIHLIYIYIDR